MLFKRNPVKRSSSLLLFSLAVLLPLTLSCGKESGAEDPHPGMASVSFRPTDENFPNPERGFYSAVGIHDASRAPISDAAVSAARMYGRTLFLMEFYLTDYVESDIAADYLEMIRSQFQALRSYGAKALLRFEYSDGMYEKDKPWDASPEQVLRHIQQLKPLLQEYYDVILLVQAGFIGSWGEWYYTENFPDVDKDPLPRRQVVDALLDALPADRQVALRTPAYKMKMYGYTLADTVSRVTAHGNTPQARLGGHNDCYLAGPNDTGTYNGTNDRAYWGAESLYTFMGGESCQTSVYCHCGPQDNAPGAMADLATNHFSYLNIGYHQKVLQRWKDEGCFEDVQRRLGYRYVLDKAYFTKDAAAGAPLQVIIDLHNEGFSPAQNPRDAELVLTDASGKVVKTWTLSSDPRYWMPEEKISIEQTIQLPEGLSGELDLWMNLPDPCETLRSNPLFSIRLANDGIWNEKTGYNKLYSFTL